MIAENISLAFNLEKIYDDASFNISEFDKVGVVGVNGAGKTTLFKVILNELELDSGKIKVGNKRIGYLPQEIVIKEEKIAKLEIAAKKLGKTKATIIYEFEIKNNGDIDTYITNLADYMPKGLEFDEKTNSGWYKSEEGKLYNLSLVNTKIEPGKIKKLRLALTQNITDDTLGSYINKAEIIETTNDKKISENNLENNNSIDLQELSFDNQFSNVNESMNTEFDMNEINVPSVELDKEKNSLENGQLNNEKLSNSFENMYMGNNIGNDFNYKSNVSTDNFTTSINKEEPIFKSSPIIDTTQNYNLQTDLKNPLDLDKGISPDIEDKNNANDFYKPEVKPEPIIVNEYNQQYDPIMPDNNVKPSIDFKSILGLIRKCSAAIENSGYKIETEEYNLDNLYQVVFKIEKR